MSSRAEQQEQRQRVQAVVDMQGWLPDTERDLMRQYIEREEGDLEGLAVYLEQQAEEENRYAATDGAKV